MTMDIYWNSHKNLFSCRINGKVLYHVKEMFLIDCKFIVSEKGRKRVIKSKVKNVHAVIRGKIAPTIITDGNYLPLQDLLSLLKHTVTYNPYTMESFMTEDGSAIHDAPFVWCAIANGKPQVRIG
jgi:hypothetical protein